MKTTSTRDFPRRLGFSTAVRTANTLHYKGWAIFEGLSSPRLQLTLDGSVHSEIKLNQPRRDVAERFELDPDTQLGFDLPTELADDTTPDRYTLELFDGENLVTSLKGEVKVSEPPLKDTRRRLGFSPILKKTDGLHYRGWAVFDGVSAPRLQLRLGDAVFPDVKLNELRRDVAHELKLNPEEKLGFSFSSPDAFSTVPETFVLEIFDGDTKVSRLEGDAVFRQPAEKSEAPKKPASRRRLGFSPAVKLTDGLHYRGWAIFDGLKDPRLQLRVEETVFSDVKLSEQRLDIAKKYDLNEGDMHGFDVLTEFPQEKLPDQVTLELFDGQKMVANVTSPLDLRDRSVQGEVQLSLVNSGMALLRGWVIGMNAAHSVVVVEAAGRELGRFFPDQERADIADLRGQRKEWVRGFTLFVDLPEQIETSVLTLFLEDKQGRHNFANVRLKELITRRELEEDVLSSAKPNSKPVGGMGLLGRGARSFAAPWVERLFPGYNDALERFRSQISDMEVLLAVLAEENIRLTDELASLKRHQKRMDDPIPVMKTLQRAMTAGWGGQEPQVGQFSIEETDDGRFAKGWSLDPTVNDACKAFVIHDGHSNLISVEPNIAHEEIAALLGAKNPTIGFRVQVPFELTSDLFVFGVGSGDVVTNLTQVAPDTEWDAGRKDA